MPHGGGGSGGGMGAAGSGGWSDGGGGWSDGMRNDYYYGTYNNDEYNNSSYLDTKSTGCLKVVCLCSVLGLLFVFFICLSWYPFSTQFEMDPMIHGENVNLCLSYSPYWYEELSASSDAQSNEQGLFYFRRCPQPNIIRSTQYETSIGDILFHYEGFYLNKESTLILNWNATQRLDFAIYKNKAQYQDGNSLYKAKGVSSMHDFNFQALSTSYYIFYWSSSSKDPWEGFANFSFALRSYNTQMADEECLLGAELCSFNLEPQSCVIVDMYNLTQQGDVVTEVFTKGNGGKYFGIVMAPFLVMAFLCLFIWYKTK